MERQQIAAQLYTVRDFCRTAEDLRTTCQKLARIGYKAVQVSGIGPIPPEQVKEIMDECGLKICITHVPYYTLVNDPMEIVRMHKVYETENVGIGSMPGEYWNSYEGQMTFARQMVKSAAILREHGLQLAYHNHSFEFTRFPEGVPMEAMAELFMENGVDFILDLYWLQAAGAFPVEWIYKVAGHMKVAHFKDMTVTDNHSAMAAVGEGNMNYRSIIKACDDTGVKWAAVEQDTCPIDPFECMKISYNNIVNMIEETR